MYRIIYGFMKLKTLIYIAFILPVFIGLVVTDSYAQQATGSGDRFSIGVSARVVNTIEIVTIRDMQFGPVQPGQQQISIDPLQDSETGKMIAIGIPGSSIKVSFVRERTLTRVDGSSTLTFTYEIAGNDQDDQSSAELLQSENRNLDLNEEGEYYFWIGGQVNIEDAKPGQYNGDFTIEVEYI